MAWMAPLQHTRLLRPNPTPNLARGDRRARVYYSSVTGLGALRILGLSDWVQD
ncbi:hypothetical protein BD310DRAFT_939939 [Dichomitus squalens]|uniref:Uncharacterized protein n=1 Tax=Dichomitus squalens TaxID=114155 RepID=A0A4Q9PCN8_9APHY|nr:hypothetical protein BD310DRAFT_939939 [Dichomitus squalens]